MEDRKAVYARLHARLDKVGDDISKVHRAIDEIERNIPSLKLNS